MAVRMSAATGNFSAAGTWQTVDPTSYLAAYSAGWTVTTGWTVPSQPFTPGAITIDGFALRVSSRVAVPTGTISARIETGGVAVTGATVTVNCSDMPAADSSTPNGGWVFFRFAAPITLLAATAYSVSAAASVSGQVVLCRGAAALGDLLRALRTSTTGAPTAGDDLIICGEYSGAGTGNSYTVTMDALASSITSYGSGGTAAISPGVSVSAKSILRYGAAAATNYYLRLATNMCVFSGGEFDMGTVATPIPRDSTAVLNFACVAAVDFGLTVHNLGTFISQGLSRTSGKNIYTCKLNADAAVNATSLGVDTDTGWLSGDQIAVASTSRTNTECEGGTLNGNAGASALTVNGFAGAGGGVAFAHSGTTPTQGEIILLTRNVQIFGASAALSSYIDTKATAVIDCDWTEFKWLGSAIGNKLGIDIGGAGVSTQIWQYCSRHTSTVSGCSGWNMNGSPGSLANIQILNCVGFNIASSFITNTVGLLTLDSCIAMLNTVNNSFFNFTINGCTITNNVIVGAQVAGRLGGAIGTSYGIFSGNTWHSCISGFIFRGGINTAEAVVSSTTIWRINGSGMSLNTSLTNVRFSTMTIFGCAADGINLNVGANNLTFENCTLSGDTTFATPKGVSLFSQTALAKIRFINCSFGVVTGIKTAHTTADFAQGLNFGIGYVDVVLINCLLASATEVANQGNMDVGSSIGSQKHDQTNGLHKTWKPQGTLALDTGTVHTGSQSLSMTPVSGATSTNKLESSPIQVAVANGATVTPTVFIRKSAAYDGNQPRLVLKRNDAIGVSADTVIATYSSGTGSWNSISGVSPAATDDGVMEFVVDCDYGTGGVVYVDSFTAA